MAWTNLTMTGVFDEPKLAPKNYRELKGFVKGENQSGACAGIPLHEVPFYTNLWQAAYKTECGACGSVNTLCIYADWQHDLVGKDDNYELVCTDCGKYTTYNYQD